MNSIRTLQRSEGTRLDLGDVLLYFMLMAILFSVFIRGRLSCCRNREHRRRQESARNAAMAAGGTSDRIKNMTQSERIEYVNDRLIVETQVVEASEASGDIELAQNTSMVSEGTVSERHQCAVCLDAMRPGEPVGTSPNPKCSHTYHKDCIYEWLLVNEHCPECRRNYLDPEPDEPGVASNPESAADDESPPSDRVEY